MGEPAVQPMRPKLRAEWVCLQQLDDGEAVSFFVQQVSLQIL